MPKDAKKNLRGNEEFEGYAVDLIAEIAEILSKFYAIMRTKQINFIVQIRILRWITNKSKYGSFAVLNKPNRCN